jgi:hypothetical protein
MPASRITGVVRDPAGAPVAGVVVSFHPGFYPGANAYAETNTDENGYYSLILPEQRAAFRGAIYPTNFIFARSIERNLAAIEASPKIPTHLDLKLRPGITLTGSVKDVEGAAVSNATVELDFRWEGKILRFDRRLTPARQPIRVDAQGFFSIPALPQGLEYLFLQNGITADGYGSTSGHVDAELTHTNHYEFPPFVLKRANRILAGQVLGVDGQPLAGAHVSYSGEGQRQFSSAESDSQGHFEFKAVAEGPVRLGTSHTATMDGTTVTIPDNVEAKAGDTNIILRLRNPYP